MNSGRFKGAEKGKEQQGREEVEGRGGGRGWVDGKLCPFLFKNGVFV